MGVRSRHRAGLRGGFTLTELMVAVAVLIVVVLATGRIFGTVSQVTSMSTATTDVLQEVAGIERRLREDFARLSHEGVFAITSYAVPNDLYGGGVLINPALPPTAVVRCDQIVFFTGGLAMSQASRFVGTSLGKARSTDSRVYYGHAFQLPAAYEAQVQGNVIRAHDPAPTALITPWHSGTAPMQLTEYCTVSAGCDVLSGNPSPAIDATQPEARRWLLARQAVMLADDDDGDRDSNSKTVYLNDVITARSIFRIDPDLGQTPTILQGRVDAAATRLSDVRRLLEWNFPSWPAQRNQIAGNLVYFPRAERYAPSVHRLDQALTNSVLGTACSSFIVEWTYDDGVGAAPGYGGVNIPPSIEQPWFGFPDLSRGVRLYGQWSDDPPPGAAGAQTIDPVDIEKTGQFDGIQYMNAVFGFNHDQPLDPDGNVWNTATTGIAYTPWPSAVRITLVLHDPALTLEEGREFQFVIPLLGRDG